MLDIRTLTNLREILNLRKLCKLSGVNYYTVKNKTLAYKRRPHKCFVTQRSKEVDKRSICTKGFGGTSITDALSFYRRRPDVDTEIVTFEDWMWSKSRKKSEVEEQISFSIDFKEWLSTLGELERKILDYLMLGYKVKDICELLKMAYSKLKNLIHDLKISFLNFFSEPNGALT